MNTTLGFNALCIFYTASNHQVKTCQLKMTRVVSATLLRVCSPIYIYQQLCSFPIAIKSFIMELSCCRGSVNRTFQRQVESYCTSMNTSSDLTKDPTDLLHNQANILKTSCTYTFKNNHNNNFSPVSGGTKKKIRGPHCSLKRKNY